MWILFTLEIRNFKVQVLAVTSTVGRWGSSLWYKARCEDVAHKSGSRHSEFRVLEPAD